MRFGKRVYAERSCPSRCRSVTIWYLWLLAGLVWFSGCSKSYRTPDFSTDSRDAIAASIEDVRLSLNDALEWAPESICRVGRCAASVTGGCLGDSRQAAHIRYVWLSCLTDPVRESDPSGSASSDGVGEAPIDFVSCRPDEAARYIETMVSASPERRAWLHDQLELVDQIRLRLRIESPEQIGEFRSAVNEIDVRIAMVRARYQSEMGQLRSDGAPGEVIGTWEDRYQTALTDLAALEEGLTSLRDAVESSADFARRRFAEAASRIASTGFDAWSGGRCENEE